MAGADATAQHLQTPRELLAELAFDERSTPPPASFRQGVAERTLARLGITADAAGVRGDDASARWNARLQEMLGELPQERHRMGDEDACFAGELWTGSINAHTLRAPNGGALLVVDGGLIGYVYKLARALALLLDFSQEPKPGDALTLEQLATLLAAGIAWYREIGEPRTDDFSVGPLRMSFASRSTTHAETFFLAHELGHVVLGHLEGRLDALEIRDVEVRSARTGPLEEAQADQFGTEMLLQRLAGTDDALQYRMAWAGVHSFFVGARLLEQLEPPTGEQTHAPADERLAAVRAYLELRMTPNTYAGTTSLGPFVEQLADAVAAAVAVAVRGEDHPARRSALSRRIDELLATSSDPPDVRGFDRELGEAVWATPPAVACDVLAERFEAAGSDAGEAFLLTRFLVQRPALRRAVDARLPVPVLYRIDEYLYGET